MAPLKYLALFGAWLYDRLTVRPSGLSQCLGLIDFQASTDHVDRVGLIESARRIGEDPEPAEAQ